MRTLKDLIILIGLIILMALPLWFLWNILMPNIFGLTTINIWEAIGIMFLSQMLFGKYVNVNYE